MEMMFFVFLCVVAVVFYVFMLIKWWKSANYIENIDSQFEELSSSITELSSSLKHIKAQVCKTYSNRYKLLKLLYKPNMDKVKFEKLIYNNLFEELVELYENQNSGTNALLNEVKEYYTKLYEKANINKSVLLELNDINQFEKFITL